MRAELAFWKKSLQDKARQDMISHIVSLNLCIHVMKDTGSQCFALMYKMFLRHE